MTEPEAAPTRRRRGGAGRMLLVGAAVLLVAAAATVAALGLGGGGTDAAARTPDPTAVTVQVTRRTLTDARNVDGTLDYGAPAPLRLKATGTITWLPAQGAVIERGKQLIRVDDRPVVLLYGDLPHYRELSVAAPAGTAKPPADTAKPPAATGQPPADTAKTPAAAVPAGSAAPPPPVTGNDVRQFETNLKAIGYAGFTVDTQFTDATAQAVKRWQKDLGLPQTGVVGVGDVVYAPGPVRIAQLKGGVGADVGAETLTVSSTVRVVTVKVNAEDLAWATKGTAVGVALPTGKNVAGTVADTGNTGSDGQASDGGSATAAGGGSGSAARDATLPVVVTLDDQGALGDLQGGPVTVTYVAKKLENALCVPVPALVALVEGGYGLEVVDGGSTRFVPVQTGMFADGFVQVSGDALREGMTVRTAR